MQAMTPKFQGVYVDFEDKKARLVTANHPYSKPDEIVLSDRGGQIVLKSERVARELTEPFSRSADTFDVGLFPKVLQEVLAQKDYTVRSAMNFHYTRSFSGVPYGSHDDMTPSEISRTMPHFRKWAASLLAKVNQGTLRVELQPETVKKYRTWLPDKVTYQGDSLVLHDTPEPDKSFGRPAPRK